MTKPVRSKAATRRRKRIVFGLIAAVLTWLVVDSCAYVVLNTFQKSHNVFLGHETPEQADIERFCETRFHPRWGWDIDPEKRGALGNRGAKAYPPKERYAMKLFGDSFAYGYGVEDDETLAHFVEAATGEACLNFAVPGYGTDQAFLKYQANQVKSKYAVLGVLDENVGRCMTVWWNFYQREGFAGTKPRFMLQNGVPTLVENPSATCDDLMKLTDPAYVQDLERYDYWSGYFRDINAPHHLSWPASVTVLPHLDYFTSNFVTLLRNRISPSYESLLSQMRVFHLYEPGSEGVVIMTHLVDAFAAEAKARGEIPLVLVFPMKSSVDLLARFGRQPCEPLVEHLASAGIDHIDFGPLFAEEDYSAYYLESDGHFSPEGNKRVAGQIVTHLKGVEVEAITE